jgi:hypothetical protein
LLGALIVGVFTEGVLIVREGFDELLELLLVLGRR